MNAGYITGDNECFWVLKDGLYQLTGVDGSSSGWVLKKKAAFTPGANVTITDNLLGAGTSLFIVSNGQGWTYDTLTETLALLEPLSLTQVNVDYSEVVIPLGDRLHPTSCTFIDGYVVFSLQDLNQFYWTNLYSTNIDALNFASAEVNSDTVIGVLNNNEDLWVFGQKTTELWYDVGQGNVVFTRRPGLLIETGCVSPTTICKVTDNRIAWLASNDRGGPAVVLTEGYNPVRISTYAIEQQWSDLSEEQLSQATAFVYTQEGHTFYVLNIPGLTSTWVYDLTTSTLLGQPMWHERCYTDPRTGQFSRWRADGHVYYKNKHVVSDYETGAIYFLDPDGYTDNGDPITRQRTTPHVSNEGKRLFYDWLQVDFKPGVGDYTTLQPSVMLEYSNDGGMTWSDVITRSVGAQGAFSSRVIFRRLGTGRDRVFRVTMTDPVDWALSGASLSVSPAEH